MHIHHTAIHRSNENETPHRASKSITKTAQLCVLIVCVTMISYVADHQLKINRKPMWLLNLSVRQWNHHWNGPFECPTKAFNRDSYKLQVRCCFISLRSLLPPLHVLAPPHHENCVIWWVFSCCSTVKWKLTQFKVWPLIRVEKKTLGRLWVSYSLEGVCFCLCWYPTA